MEVKRCVACDEEISAKAQLCKHCNTIQDDPRFAKIVVKSQRKKLATPGVEVLSDTASDTAVAKKRWTSKSKTTVFAALGLCLVAVGVVTFLLATNSPQSSPDAPVASSVDQTDASIKAEQAVPIEWTDAQGIEFVRDHTTEVSTASEILDELNRQATAFNSSVEWRQDVYGAPSGLEDYVDDVLLSSGEGDRGCGLWVFGFSGWTSQAVDAGYFDWVQEEITLGEFSDEIHGYVLIYSDKQTECYTQAMRTIEGNYAPNPNVASGIKPNPFLVLEISEADTLLSIGNAGDEPIQLNDEFCIVTEKGAYVDPVWGRIVGTLNPGEAFRMDNSFSSEWDLDKNISKQLAIGNCGLGQYRAIVPRT